MARGAWIRTRSGRPFDYLDPQPDMIYWPDLVWSLSVFPRFVGHTLRPYSVACHSLYVSWLLQSWGCGIGDQWAGLMHDATEAYVGDMAKPLKDLVGEPFKRVERRVWLAIAAKYHLPEDLPPAVKRADIAALLAEKRDLGAVSQDLVEPFASQGWACLADAKARELGLECPEAPVLDCTPKQARAHFTARAWVLAPDLALPVL